MTANHRAAYGLVTAFDPLERIEADTLALAEAAAGRLTAPVPSCPGWTVADLVWHLSEVQAFWGAIVAGRVQDPAEVPEPVRPGDDALVPGLRAGVGRFVAAAAKAEPRDALWTWARQKDVAFVVRHQVQEAAVHRWDGEQAAGLDTALDTVAAADAVDEFLRISVPFSSAASGPLGAPLDLVATDAGLRWAVTEQPDGSVRSQRLSTGAPPAGTATVVRATASDLLLYLYRRRPAATMDVTGEVLVAERFALGNPTA